MNLDAKDLYLRRDILDTMTQFIEAMSRFTRGESNLNEWFAAATDLLAEDFVFESPIQLQDRIWYSRAEFLDPNTGFHVGAFGFNWDVASGVIGSNIIYTIIGNDEVEIEFPHRVLLWREECLFDGAVERVTMEGVDFARFRWNYRDSKWQMSLWDERHEIVEQFTCTLSKYK